MSGERYRLTWASSLSRWNFRQIPVVRTSQLQELTPFGMIRSQTQWLVLLITLPPVCPAFVLRLQQQALDILCSQDLGPVPVVPGGAIIPTLSIDTSSFQVGEFFRLLESWTWSVDGHQSSQYHTTHYQYWFSLGYWISNCLQLE